MSNLPPHAGTQTRTAISGRKLGLLPSFALGGIHRRFDDDFKCFDSSRARNEDRLLTVPGRTFLQGHRTRNADCAQAGMIDFLPSNGSWFALLRIDFGCARCEPDLPLLLLLLRARFFLLLPLLLLNCLAWPGLER